MTRDTLRHAMTLHYTTRHNTHMHTRTHAHTHTRTHARTHTRTHAHTRTRAHAHTRTRAHAHTRTRAHAHTRTRAHAHTRTRAHAHAHTPKSVLLLVSFLSVSHSMCFVSCSSSVLENEMAMPQPVLTPTPYGGRLTWTLPGQTIFVAHLKDKLRIRHLKRWSQVVYAVPHLPCNASKRMCFNNTRNQKVERRSD